MENVVIRGVGEVEESASGGFQATFVGVYYEGSRLFFSFRSFSFHLSQLFSPIDIDGSLSGVTIDYYSPSIVNAHQVSLIKLTPGNLLYLDDSHFTANGTNIQVGSSGTSGPLPYGTMISIVPGTAPSRLVGHFTGNYFAAYGSIVQPSRGAGVDESGGITITVVEDPGGTIESPFAGNNVFVVDVSIQQVHIFSFLSYSSFYPYIRKPLSYFFHPLSSRTTLKKPTSFDTTSLKFLEALLLVSIIHMILKAVLPHRESHVGCISLIMDQGVSNGVGKLSAMRSFMGRRQRMGCIGRGVVDRLLIWMLMQR